MASAKAGWRRMTLAMLGLAAGWLIAAPLLAQNDQDEDEPASQADASATAADPSDPAPEASGSDDTANAVMRQMLERLDQTTVVEPSQRPGDERVRAADLNPRVMGVAPDQAQPRLRREGSFVVSRRGRIARSSDGRHMLFVFEHETEQTPEPPMILVPCQMLETMETFVEKRGDQIVFILSGQVLTYRGANHLLPTMMKLAIDRGNLNQP